MDSILCTESVKYLYINAFKHVIQSTTKNKSRYVWSELELKILEVPIYGRKRKEET